MPAPDPNRRRPRTTPMPPSPAHSLPPQADLRHDHLRRPVHPSKQAALALQRKRQRRARRRFAALVFFALLLFTVIAVLIGSAIHRASKDPSLPPDTHQPTLSGPGPDHPSQSQPPVTDSPATTLPPTDPDPDAITVCIDPGHGFGDPGTGSEHLAPLYEKDVNLAIALKIRDYLTDAGIKVVMTRDSDILPTSSDWTYGDLLDPNERVLMLSGMKDVDYFISIHCNSYTGQGRAWGPRIYHYKKNGSEAEPLANEIAKGIYARLDAKQPQVNAMDESAFAVIRHSICPALLIEVGFVTDEKEAANMKIDAWRDNMAAGIANGLIAHIRAGSEG